MNSVVVLRTNETRSERGAEVCARVEDLVLLPTVFSIGRSTRALMGLQLEQLSLNAGQDQLLVLLDLNEAISVGEAANALNVRPSTVSKMVDRLLAAGYITRARSDRDSRQCVLRLTAYGDGKRSEVLALWGRIERELLRALSETDALTNVDAVAEALRRRLSRLR